MWGCRRGKRRRRRSRSCAAGGSLQAVQEALRGQGAQGQAGQDALRQAQPDCSRRAGQGQRWGRRPGRAGAPPPLPPPSRSGGTCRGPRRPSGPVPGAPGARAERSRPVSSTLAMEPPLATVALLDGGVVLARGPGQVAVRSGAEGDPLHRALAGGGDVRRPLPAVQEGSAGGRRGRGHHLGEGQVLRVLALHHVRVPEPGVAPDVGARLPVRARAAGGTRSSRPGPPSGDGAAPACDLRRSQTHPSGARCAAPVALRGLLLVEAERGGDVLRLQRARRPAGR